ncbi:MAG: hypothetical protein ABIP75_19730 [Pyrinomonadaceae bacterium]
MQLIEEVVSDAKLVDSFADRAEIQSEVAYYLWPADRNRARTLFRIAWESAGAADKESQTPRRVTNGDSTSSEGPFTYIRGTVLLSAASRDQALADEFLAAMTKEEASESNDNSDTSSNEDPFGELSPAAEHRLSLAMSLLHEGDPARATEFASPAFNEGVSWRQISFLSDLWTVDAAGADRLYLQLVDRTRRDPKADPNDILLLSTPIVSPGLLCVVDAQGSVRSQVWGSNRPVPLSPGARESFLIAAAEILLRPQIPSGENGRSPQAYAGYFAAERLLSFFDREAPQFSGPLRMRSNSLTSEIGAAWISNLDQRLLNGEYPVNRHGDPLRNQLDELEETTDAGERDGLLLEVVAVAARRRMWDRARQNADKITDAGRRRGALSYIQVCQIADLTRTAKEDKEADFFSFASFVRKADVSPLVTAWGLAQTALIAKRLNNNPAATALFNEASTYAGKTESGTYRRVAGYVMLANMILQHDQKQSWFVLPEIVQVVNSLNQYPADDNFLDLLPELAPSLGFNSDFLVSADEFRLDKLFAALAALDFDRAADFARSFGPRMARIDAVMAVAKVELSKK